MLQVDGSLHLYTTLLGWQLFGVIWDLLKATGLVWLPILGVLIDHISEVRSRGSLMRSDAESAFAGLEVQFFLMILVVLIGAVPQTTLNASSLNYRDTADIHHTGTINRTIDSTGSLADTTPQSTIVTTTGVDVPLWWYVVMQTSNGFRYALESTFDTYGNSYRTLRSIANTVAISNPDLKRQVDEFYSFCYLPALSNYRNGTSDGSSLLVGTATDSAVEGPDVSWIGAQVFVNGYYKNHHMPYIVPGYPYDPTYDTEYASSPGAGAPLCSTYWAGDGTVEGIRDRIYAEATADGFIGTLKQAAPWLSGALDAATFLTPDEDDVARKYLENSIPEFSQSADRLVALRKGDAGVLENAGRLAASVVQVYQYGKMAAVMEIALDALIYALIVGQAYLLAVIYLSMPFALLLGRYSFATLMGGAILIFAVNFFSVLWTFVAFLDNWIALQLWNGQSMWQTLASFGGLEEIKKRLIHSIMIGSLYLTSTLGFGYVLIIGGSRIGFAISNSASSITGGFSTARAGPIGSGASARRTAGGATSMIKAYKDVRGGR